MAAVNKKNEDALSHQTLTNLLDYNPETGIFTWKVMMSSTAMPGQAAGSYSPRGYLLIRLNGKRYYAHRLAWFYIHKEWPNNQIDHIDQDKGNNCISNLRDVNHSINMYNTPLRSHNTSGVRGVNFVERDRIWRAYITINKKRIHLGSFVDFQQAVKARKEAETKYER